MLKVTSVEEAVAYWTQKGGTVTRSTTKDDGKLRGAFVALGNGQTTDNCFALELSPTQKFELGNIMNYIGVSKLMQFQTGNLRELLESSCGETEDDPVEPHGIPVQSCAASPGDFLCRLCLQSNNLEATQAFYVDTLGMQVAAGDQSQLCLRYQPPDSDTAYGVPTTLVFDGTNKILQHGTCWDHLAIQTTTSIQALHQRLLQDDDAFVYMNPTEMFGLTVMGLRDPNGYKVVLAGPA